MVTELLGLHADGFDKRLTVRRPLLPDEVDGLALQGLRVAGGTASVRFTRQGDAARTEILASDGVEVVVE